MSQDRLWPWALTASVALPMVLYTLTAAPGPYWLDSGEFVASTWLMGVPHPPGHPLHTLSSLPLTFLPVGNLALRVNLASALWTSVSTGLLAWTLRRIALTAGVPRGRASLGAMLTAVLTATSYALWFQAVRAEVYALHLAVAAAVTAIAVEMELRAAGPWPQEGPSQSPERSAAPQDGEASDDDGQPDATQRQQVADPRLLMALAFGLGLGLANHHYLVVFIGPPILAMMLARAAWRRVLLSGSGLRATGFGLLGLATYAMLPLRAARDPMVNWGDPDTPGQFIWVITAQAFQKSLERVEQVESGELLVNLAVVLGRQMTPVAVVLALVGLFWLLRRAQRRGLGLLLGGLLVFNLITKALMNFDPNNPDLHGYFGLSVWLTGLLVGVAWILLDRAGAHIEHHDPASPGVPVARALSPFGLGALALMLSVNAWLTLPEARLDRFHAVEVVNHATLDPLPEGAVLITSNFKTIFNLWYAQGVEQRRPDLAVIHRNYVTTPSYAAQMRQTFPELSQLIADTEQGPRFDFEAARELAATRPVYLEYDVNIPANVAHYLRPAGVVLRLMPAPGPSGPLPKPLVEQQVAIWNGLHARLATHAEPAALDMETQRYLIWVHYLNARAMLDANHPILALFHMEKVRAVNPASPELRELDERLRELGVRDAPAAPSSQ